MARLSRRSATYTVASRPEMPRCSWLLDMDNTGAILYRGPSVETGENWFFEGAWAGPYDAEGLRSADLRFGSGALLFPTRVHVLPPTHPLEAIYCLVFKNQGRTLVSNSFPCLVGVVPGMLESLDITSVVKNAQTVKRGARHYQRLLAQGPEWTLFRFAYNKVEIAFDDQTPHELHSSASPPPFEDYSGYLRYLRQSVASAVENARSPERESVYSRQVTGCSTGYDSPACAVVAQSAGCEQAVTLSTARGGRNDSGREIAEALGLFCSEFPRFATADEMEERKDHYVDISALGDDLEPYADFLTSILTLEDAVYAPFEPLITQGVFFSGFLGGKVWAKNGDNSPYIVRSDNSGGGIDEFRKRVGFVHIPVPFIGASHSATIRAITNSSEMEPYVTGERYDRPIPRRVVEEAGVPREAFGQTKERGSVLFMNTQGIREHFVERAAEDYRSAIRLA